MNHVDLDYSIQYRMDSIFYSSTSTQNWLVRPLVDGFAAGRSKSEVHDFLRRDFKSTFVQTLRQRLQGSKGGHQKVIERRS